MENGYNHSVGIGSAAMNRSGCMQGRSMSNQETLVELAERHVREGEARIARQRAILDDMVRDGHPQAAHMAQIVLDTMLRTLQLAQAHLAFERMRMNEQLKQSD